MMHAPSGGVCRLVLVRHEHTALAGTFCGQSDPPLSAVGKAALQNVVRRMRPYPLQCVYSSDLRRTQQTASAITQMLRLPLHLRSDLSEIAFGDWEGLDWQRVVARNPEYAQRWLANYPELHAPGGEPFADFRQRVNNAIATIADEVSNGCAAVVTHAGVIRAFLGEVLLSPEQTMQFSTPDYGSTIEVWRRNGTWMFPIATLESAAVSEDPANPHLRTKL